ncbi:MAG: zinc finger domain-containing protein [Candidatus Eiseniibacteriota bacterium]
MTRTRTVASVTRSEARALLTHYRLAGAAPVTDDLVTAWVRDLRGYSAGECHAALVAMAAHRSGALTPAEITTRIDSARAHPVTPAPHDPGRTRPRNRDRTGERARAEAAGARGIRAVYAAMGWEHHPDRDLALAVPCRFCRARAGQVCTPMVRNRAGQRDKRDPGSGMHHSRIAEAHAENREQAR